MGNYIVWTYKAACGSFVQASYVGTSAVMKYCENIAKAERMDRDRAKMIALQIGGVVLEIVE